MSTINDEMDEQRVVVGRRSWRAFAQYQQGRWGYVLAWALGVPIPILILVYLLRGCT